MKTIVIIILSLICVSAFAQTQIDPSASPTTARINAAIKGSITASGTDTYSGTLTGATYSSGDAFTVTFTNPNTTAATFNLNSTSDVPIKKYNSSASLVDVIANDLKGGIRIRYNGTYWVVEGGGGSGGGSGTVTSITALSPLTGGTITTTGTIGISDATTTTKGAASFNSSDFDVASGAVNIDYVNGQAAGASTNGFVTTGAQTIAGAKTFSSAPTMSGANISSSTIANASLANSSITIAGNSTSLGGTVTQDNITGLASTGLVKRTAANTLGIAASGIDYAPATSGTSILYGNGSGGFSNVTIGSGLSFSTGTLSASGSSGLTIGSTSISSGTAGRLLYNNSGTLGEYSTIPLANGGTNTDNTSQTNSLGFFAPTPGLYNSTLSTGSASWRSIVNTDLPAKSRSQYSLFGAPYLFGDSYALDQQASPATYGFARQLAQIYDVTFNNLALGGRGVTYAAFTAYANMPVYGNKQPVVIAAGFNDLRRGGSASSTLNKITGALNAIICNAFLRNAIAASAATNTGTWSNYTTFTGKAANLSGNSRQSTTSGDVISWTTTDVTDNVVIGTYGTDGSTYNWGRFTVTIDGTVVDTFDPNGKSDLQSDGTYDNGVSPYALHYSGLNAATHTVTLTLLDAKTTVIDYIGYLQDPEYCAPIFISNPPRMNATGYTVSPSNASDAVMTAGKNTIFTVCNTTFIRRPVQFVDLDEYWDISTSIGADNVHPNNVGYTNITRAFQSVINTKHGVFNKLYFTPSTTGYYPSVIGASTSGTASTFTAKVNRDFGGNSFNTGLAEAQLDGYADNGSSKWVFSTSASNNTSPANTVTINGNGGIDLLATSNVSHLTWTNSTTNKAWTGLNTSNQYGIWINRTPGSGTVINTGLTEFQMVATTASGDSNLGIYTSPTNNTTPVLGWVLDKNQNTKMVAAYVGSSATSPTSTLQIGGSIAPAYISKATSYTATISDCVIEVTATGQTITLPTAASITGRIYTIKLTASGSGTVATTSSQTIDGSTTYSLSAQYKYVTVQSNGSNWIIIANN